MPDNVLRVQAVFERDTALPEDRVINTWHFDYPTAGRTAAIAGITTALNNFYRTVPSGSTADVETFLSPTFSGVWSLRFYDLEDEKPRIPVEVTAMTNIAPGSSPLPDEVSMCLSFRAAIASGDNPRRRKGRVYIGPLAAGSATIGSDGKPATGANLIVQTLKAAGSALRDASLATADWSWCVYSEADDAAYPVVTGWVDNAFDIQRRRGLAPTTRSNFT